MLVGIALSKMRCLRTCVGTTGSYGGNTYSHVWKRGVREQSILTRRLTSRCELLLSKMTSFTVSMRRGHSGYSSIKGARKRSLREAIPNLENFVFITDNKRPHPDLMF